MNINKAVYWFSQTNMLQSYLHKNTKIIPKYKVIFVPVSLFNWVLKSHAGLPITSFELLFSLVSLQVGFRQETRVLLSSKLYPQITRFKGTDKIKLSTSYLKELKLLIMYSKMLVYWFYLGN